MSRVYTCSWQGTVTAAGGDTDWLEILPADDKPVRLRGFIFGQITEVGDTAEEGVRITILRLPATVTSGSGTAITPAQTDSADAAAGCTVEGNGATIATTTGTAVVLQEIGWINRASPYEFWYPDERFCPVAKQGEALIMRQQTTLADDMTLVFTAWIEEL